MYKYHCPKCKSNNTKRAILITSFEKLTMPNGDMYNPRQHGNPFRCLECNNVFAVGIDKISYLEHCKKAGEEAEEIRKIKK